MKVITIERDLIGYLNSVFAERPARRVEAGVLHVIDEVVKADDLKTETELLGRIKVSREIINPDFPKFKPDLSYQIAFRTPEPLDVAYGYFRDFEEKIHDAIYGKLWPWSNVGPLMKIGDMTAEFVGMPHFQGEWRIYIKIQPSQEQGLYATATINKEVRKLWRKEDIGSFADDYRSIDQGSTEYIIRGIPAVRKVPKVELTKRFMLGDEAGMELFFSEASAMGDEILLLDPKNEGMARILKKGDGFERRITYTMPYRRSTLCAELRL